ncbi:5-methylcytosine-specific restriction protein B [Clostridiales Family XIII bacterium PM5-7]
MPKYQWASGSGEIIESDYNRVTDTLDNNQVKSELQTAFSQYNHQISCQEANDELKEVFVISFEDGYSDPIFVCAKGTTPGGRSNLNDEQRTQQKSKYINYTYEQKQSGNQAVQLGIYRRDGQTIFCAWILKQSSAAAETPISKQIKIATIAQAMKEGFVQQDKGSGEYACAFRKEFIYFYIRNASWLHGSLVTQLAEHTQPLSEETAVNPNEQKAKFKAWLSSQKKANGDLYNSNTVDSYISNMGRGYNEFEKYKDYDSVFQIQDTDELKEYTDYLFNEPGFDDFNDRAGNKACSCGLAKYDEFLKENTELPEIRFKTELESEFYRNRILFGAPGTGKSFTLNKERKKLLGDDNEIDYERVTFHPDYSYANFVGTYKPVPCKDSDGKDAITYEYVSGPFMRIYVEALKNGRTDDVKPFLLIIEEINRANVAAVFGDIFQLLDRDDDEVSEYPIQASEDIKKYLMKELKVSEEQCKKIKIPDNMFIWATMNSADQGVFPMDTAFKRRWDFTYLGIDDSEKELIGKTVVLGKGQTKHQIEWNKLRKAINKFLAKNKVNEDKQLGPYFIPKKIVVPINGNEIDREAFVNTFKNKVLMYLFEDAAKQKRSSLFEGCFDNSSRYSEICKEFEIKGIGIFNSEIQNATEPKDLPNVVEGNTVEENEE